MRGIIIAAGMGMRMRPHTDLTPKCQLNIAGRPLLDWTVDGLQAAGCGEIVVITGHCAEMIRRRDVLRVHNDDFPNNNILHSLMYARDYLDDDVIVSYSDIWVEPHIHLALAQAQGDIVLVVDRDWEPYYEGRSDHPLKEAEKIHYDSAGRVHAAGKHLTAVESDMLVCGEFLGLWKMTAQGARQFRAAFEALDIRLSRDEPFQNAVQWRRAYITDMVQHLTDAGAPVHALIVERGWAELDTAQDYERLPGIAARQKLKQLTAALPKGKASDD